MRNRWVSPVAVLVLALVIVLGAVFDPAGLAAPYTWTGAQLLPVAGLWQVAALVVYVPLLLAGTGVLAWLVSFRGAPLRTAVLVWGAVVLSAMVAKLAMSLVMASGDLAYLAWSTGFTGVKAMLFGLPSALAAWIVQLATRRTPTPPEPPTASPPGTTGSGASAQKPLGASAEGPLGVGAEGPLGASAEGPLGVSAEGPLGVSAEGPLGVGAEGPLGASAGGPLGVSAEGPLGASAGGPLGASAEGQGGGNADPAYGGGGQVAGRVRGGSAGWVAAAVSVLLAAVIGGSWWGGSPIGYAIGDSPLAPAPEAGPLGCLLAVALLGAATWALDRWLQGAIPWAPQGSERAVLASAGSRCAALASAGPRGAGHASAGSGDVGLASPGGRGAGLRGARAAVAAISSLGAAGALALVQVAIALPGDMAGGDTFWAPAIMLRLGSTLSFGALLAIAVGLISLALPIHIPKPAASGSAASELAVSGSAASELAVSGSVAEGAGASNPAATGRGGSEVGVSRRVWGVGVAVVAIAALAVPLLRLETPLARPQLTAGLSLDAGRRIVDSTGNEVLLRGVNVNQLEDYFQKFPDKAVNRPLTEDDFAGMERMGFNVVRLALSWSALEPEPGRYDQRYLDRITWAVSTAAKHGLRTVLDMHQDAWGKGVNAEKGTTCANGSPMHGWDGAPAWADRFDGAPKCEFTGRDISPAVARAFTNFYQDRDGIQTRLVATWGMLAARFASEPMVAGYDLLNEPGFGEAPPITSGVLLGRYYDRAIKAIRAAEKGGFPHLVFFEPSVLWSGLGFEASVPKDFTDDRQIVFAPHLYNESITIDQGTGVTVTSLERGFDLASRAAAAYGAGLWSGEWGWFGDPAAAPMGRYTAQEDKYRIGGAFWVWKQSCGDAHAGADDKTGGNLMIEDCATGKDLPPPAEYVAALSRPYPRSAPGHLTTLTSDRAGLTLRGEGTGCGLDIWFPGTAKPTTTSTGLTNVTTRQAPGGWRITACTQGTYTLEARN